MNKSTSLIRTKLNRISSYEDARAKARYALPRGLFDYIDGGSEGEYTMRRNIEAFEELVWRPKQAIYHEQIDTATEVLGTKLAMPVMTAPCGGMTIGKELLEKRTHYEVQQRSQTASGNSYSSSSRNRAPSPPGSTRWR